MKIIAWIIVGVIALILIGLLYYLVVGQILFSVVFSKKSLSKRTLRKDLHQALVDYKIDLCWWDKVKFKKITTKSFDELNLIGHFFDAKSNITALVVHGFGQDYREMQPYCKFFYDKGFNVLVTDNRGHGESEGSIGFGWLDRKDIQSWIDLLNSHNPENKLILFGLSMGATAVCCVSGEELPQNVEAVISDCAFANADNQIDHILSKHKIVKRLFKKHLYSFSKRVKEFDIVAIDALKMVKKSKCPILYFHGEADKFVPVENIFKLYQNTTTAEKLIVENATHAMAYPIAGVVYEKKISDFLKSRTNIFN